MTSSSGAESTVGAGPPRHALDHDSSEGESVFAWARLARASLAGGCCRGLAGGKARRMVFKSLVLSIVFVPPLVGIWVALSRGGRRGLPLLLGLVLAYDVLYIFLLYFLRYRWL